MGKLITLNPHTRASLDAAKTAGTLDAGELYHITDEARIAVGCGASAYIALLKEGEGALTGVAAPTNLLPKPGAIGLTNVRLVGSIYYSTEGKAHQATKVQISTSAAFGTLAFEATKGAVTSVQIKSADIASDASYYWRMAYQDAEGAWSDWSVPTAFAVGTMIDLPEGGTITTDGDYTIHTFTSSGTFVLPAGRTVDVLIVAGGGGGGGDIGGGGGGGGVVYKTAQVIAAGSYAVTVGAGGNGATGFLTGLKGANSSLVGVDAAIGGGGGGGWSSTAPTIGGSGGGAGHGDFPGAAGTATQGFAGGAGYGPYATGGGGGGGAAGGVGSPASAGAGGIGFACAISPHATHYAGGGGGGAWKGGSGNSNGGVGGLGGGGTAVLLGGGTAQAGAANTGGGGAGGSYAGAFYKGANGGSGIVIVRYLTA